MTYHVVPGKGLTYQHGDDGRTIQSDSKPLSPEKIDDWGGLNFGGVNIGQAIVVGYACNEIPET
jgi:hypothetical protein